MRNCDLARSTWLCSRIITFASAQPLTKGLQAQCYLDIPDDETPHDAHDGFAPKA
jgi:hypothetical protein